MGRGCGGGGLRILPHKSWNVYGYRQKQKVRRDELAHAEEEKETRSKQREVEGLVRLRVLRKRARERQEREVGLKSLAAERPKPAPQVPPVDAKDQCFSLFPKDPRKACEGRRNEERKAEEVQKNKKWLKYAMPNVFFGASEKDREGNKPWYTRERTVPAPGEHEERRSAMKEVLDPLKQVRDSFAACEAAKKALKAKESGEDRVPLFRAGAGYRRKTDEERRRRERREEEERRRRERKRSSRHTHGSEEEEEKYRHRRRKRRRDSSRQERKATRRSRSSSNSRRKKRRKKRKDSSHLQKKSKEETKLERLRRERLEREQGTRQRVSALLDVPTWATDDPNAVRMTLVSQRGYNRQSGYAHLMDRW